METQGNITGEPKLYTELLNRSSCLPVWAPPGMAELRTNRLQGLLTTPCSSWNNGLQSASIQHKALSLCL